MSYDIGSYIDLAHVNKPSQLKKKTTITATSRLLEVGTTFIAKYTEGQEFKLARRIEVAAA